MITIPQSPAQISLTQGSISTRFTIKREEANTSIRTIGVRVNPLGTTDAEFSFREQYTLKWSSMIKTSRFTNIEAIRAYQTTLIPSITYPLGAV